MEPLEEIFKRVQFIQVDLENTDFSDFDAAVALMEIIEYYDSVEELDIGYQAMSMNFRTWSSLARIVRRSHSLKCIDVQNDGKMNVNACPYSCGGVFWGVFCRFLAFFGVFWRFLAFF